MVSPLEFNQVAWVDHPYYLPSFSNALAFTFPFVVENFMKILADVLTSIGEIGYEHEAPVVCECLMLTHPLAFFKRKDTHAHIHAPHTQMGAHHVAYNSLTSW